MPSNVEKPNPNPRKRKAKSHPVPEWADENIKHAIAKMGSCERFAMAALLEKQAAQLRGFSPKPPEVAARVVVELTENQKLAVLELYGFHGGRDGEELDFKLRSGASWALDAALTMIPAISKRLNEIVHYSNCEGFDKHAYADALTLKSTAEFREWIGG